MYVKRSIVDILKKLLGQQGFKRGPFYRPEKQITNVVVV